MKGEHHLELSACVVPIYTRKEVLETVGQHLKEVYATWRAGTSSPDEQQLQILQTLEVSIE